MKDATAGFQADLSGLSAEDWLDKFEDLAEDYGYFEPLGPNHSAAFIDAGETLFVSFDTLENARNRDANALPFGYSYITSHNWSQMTLLSLGDTWFRDPWVYRFFDRLVDDGFFEDYETVIFYGERAAGYAAAAFSVASPGAKVIAISPQATLSPETTAWDTRFIQHRRLDFTSRYGYAPHMVEAADQMTLIFDPVQTADAMHASLFQGENVQKLKCRFLGKKLAKELYNSGTLDQIITKAADGTLDGAALGTIARFRRTNAPYLRGLLNWCDTRDRLYLSAMLCGHVVTTQPNRPKFEERLQELQDDGFIEREIA